MICLFDVTRNPDYIILELAANSGPILRTQHMNGSNFRRWREAHGLRTEKVAELLGYKRRQIERLEARGEGKVRRCIALALAALDSKLEPVE
jgi:hypothetical protein